MRVLVVGLVANDLREVCRQGFSHPIIGEFLDGGSYATLEGIESGPEGLAEIIGRRLEEGAAAAGVECGYAESGHGTAHAAAIQVEREATNLDGAHAEIGRWQRHLSGGGALSIVIADLSRRQPPLFCLYAHSLPCMGAMPPCAVADVHATWLRLAGGSTPAGRYLLEEQPSSFDSSDEERLIERLRQLYGD